MAFGSPTWFLMSFWLNVRGVVASDSSGSAVVWRAGGMDGWMDGRAVDAYRMLLVSR